ncbi:hypothetical protein GW17_00046373 [Ensete ventricosum]|nr:hypothetical protein GW17_00046373 [Ensete ventricosum]
MAAIFFARIQKEQLNHEIRRTRVTPRPAMLRPTTPSTAIQAAAPKKLTRDELRERSAKELYWHCNEPWSHEHHCKKGQLLMIEPAEDEDNETSEEALEPQEAMEEESQPANYAVHVLAGYSNPLMIAPNKEPKLEDMTLEPKEKDTPQPATRTKWKAGDSTREPSGYNHNTTLGRGTKRRIQWEIVYPCISDPDGEDEGGQASSSLAISTRWISTAKLLQSDLVTLIQREGGE